MYMMMMVSHSITDVVSCCGVYVYVCVFVMKVMHCKRLCGLLGMNMKHLCFYVRTWIDIWWMNPLVIYFYIPILLRTWRKRYNINIFFDELMINERTSWNNKIQQKLLSLLPWLQSIKEGITFAWQPHQPNTLIKK